MYADREEEQHRTARRTSAAGGGKARQPTPPTRRYSTSSSGGDDDFNRRGRSRSPDSRSPRSPRSMSRSRSRSSSAEHRRRREARPRTHSAAADRESELAAELRSRRAKAAAAAPAPRSSRGRSRSISRSRSPRSRSRSPRPTRDEDRRKRRSGALDDDRSPYVGRSGSARRTSVNGGARPSLERRMAPTYDNDDRRSERGSSAGRFYDDRRARRGDSRSSREPAPSRAGGYYDREPYHNQYDNRRGGGGRGYYDRGDPYGGRARMDSRDDYRRSRSPRRAAPRRAERVKTPEAVEDYELRSVFCSQLAARLGQRDLGEFFEEHLGEGTVKDVRIVTDRISGRSKGIGYVELRDEECVQRAVALSGTTLFGIPIFVQLTEAARNRGEGASTAQAPIRPNIGMPQASAAAPAAPVTIPIIDPALLANIPAAPHFATPIHLAGLSPAAMAAAARGSQANAGARLYVGQLHFEITDADLKSVFDPFGAIDNVEVHRDATTGRSKGFAFVQYRSIEDAEKAIVHMDNFELAGRPIRVGHVNARGMEGRTNSQLLEAMSGQTPTAISSLDEGGGGGLTAASRASLMEKLARTEQPATLAPPAEQHRPASIPQATSRAVLLKNMFDPAEETERDWDVELAEEVKGECEEKYGAVEKCHVDRDSAGEIWVRFIDIAGATKAIAGLNGRYFGGRTVVAHYVSESMMNATLG